MSNLELDAFQLMRSVTEFFEASGIQYHVVGSMASMAMGEPRLTNDVDIVAELSSQDVAAMCVAFPAPEYYLSEQAALAAVQSCSQFNIIHLSSGVKADIFIPQSSEFSLSAKSRIRRIGSPGEFSAWFGSPEDIILNKLIYFQLGGSEKHLRDITGMIKLNDDKLDYVYIKAWAMRLGINEEWLLILEHLGIGPA